MWLLEKVKSGTGENDNPFYCALNGKVLEFVDSKNKEYVRLKPLLAGQHIELALQKLIYDPAYELKATID